MEFVQTHGYTSNLDWKVRIRLQPIMKQEDETRISPLVSDIRILPRIASLVNYLETKMTLLEN